MKHLKTYQLFFVLAGMIVVLGFGCRNDAADQENAEDVATEPATTVTFNTGDASTTSDTSVTDSSTSDADTSSTDTGSTQDTQDANDDVLDRPTETGDGSDVSNTNISGEVDAELDELTRKIVETYGSFTNKSRVPFKNLVDLDVYGTDRFKSWSAEQRRENVDPQAPFYGITTQALSIAPLEINAGGARLLVTTEREQVTETNETKNSYYQLIIVEMVRENDEWKLDGLFWQ